MLGRTRFNLRTARRLPRSTFVWAAGTAPSPVLDLVDVPRNKSGRVEADATMAVRDRPGVWAVGDSATIPDVVTVDLSSDAAVCIAARQATGGQHRGGGSPATRPQRVSLQGAGSVGRAGTSVRRRRDVWPAVLRIHCLVAVADDLPDEAARLRAEAASGNRLDARSVFRPRYRLPASAPRGSWPAAVSREIDGHRSAIRAKLAGCRSGQVIYRKIANSTQSNPIDSYP